MNSAQPSEDLPAYDELADMLQRCHSAHSPSEAHGFAVGLQLARIDQPYDSWTLELYSDFDPADVLASECRGALDRLYEQVNAVWSGADGGFALLLPQDLVINRRRLEALRDWCQGFLFGIGLAGERLQQQGSPAMTDLLADIAEITRLQVDDDDNSDENQSALIEIEEYLRVGVMLLRDELQAGNRQDDTS